MLFLQIRRNIGAREKYHGAPMDHTGHEHTRVSREMQALGTQSVILSDVALGTGTAAKTAIMMDWGSWWALKYSAGPGCKLRYLDEVERYYQLSLELSTPMDIVSAEDNLEEHKIVAAKDQIISGVMHVIQNICNPRSFVFVEVWYLYNIDVLHLYGKKDIMPAIGKKYSDWVQKYRIIGTIAKKRDNSYYLYKRASRRVKGKKYPRSTGTYIGVITPGGVIQSDKRKVLLIDAEVWEYGFLKAVWELCPDDWRKPLGDD